LEQLLLVLYVDEEDLQKKAFDNLVVNEEAIQFWPPWPWPPWDGDDDDGHKTPKDPKKTICELAKKVIHFEQRLAEASLDL
jgi:endothelin-converting enzyme